jgi:hypothetical protein
LTSPLKYGTIIVQWEEGVEAVKKQRKVSQATKERISKGMKAAATKRRADKEFEQRKMERWRKMMKQLGYPLK